MYHLPLILLRVAAACCRNALVIENLSFFIDYLSVWIMVATVFQNSDLCKAFIIQYPALLPFETKFRHCSFSFKRYHWKAFVHLFKSAWRSITTNSSWPLLFCALDLIYQSIVQIGSTNSINFQLYPVNPALFYAFLKRY